MEPLPFLTSIIVLITASINCLKSFLDFKKERKNADQRKWKAPADNSQPSNNKNMEE